MTEISLENLNALVTAGEKLKRLLQDTPEVLEYLRLVSGVLVRAGEAAQVLGVNKETIYRYAEEKLLTPLYTPHSNQMKFWLSEVKSVAKKAG